MTRSDCIGSYEVRPAGRRWAVWSLDERGDALVGYWTNPDAAWAYVAEMERRIVASGSTRKESD